MSLMNIPPVAASIDTWLATIDAKVDWLHYLSPLNNDENWINFQRSGYSEEPELSYCAVPERFIDIKEELHRLPVDDVEHPSLHALFYEKKLELELQTDLVLLRESPGFVSISVELFGEAEPSLLGIAKKILHDVPSDYGPVNDAGAQQVVAAAQQEMAAYRRGYADFKAKVDVLDDLNSMMMVHHGDLKVARSVRLPTSRVAPLIAHEVGTHVVTRYNGRCQPIRLLEHGLAHYDPLQEGLGTLSEYLAGYLPPRRIRVIAARVVATEMALKRQSIKTIFHSLCEDYALPEDDAFDVAVRACRGGGLTKDSVYLRGLRELLAYLADGGDIEFLFLGKFAMGQRLVIRELMEQNLLTPPKIVPHHLCSDQGLARLERVREMNLEQLFQQEPEI